MLSHLGVHGPRGSQILALGGVAFAVTLADNCSTQTASIATSGHLSVVCCARLDGRDELIRLIGSDAFRNQPKVLDVDLLLAAYKKWGEDCVAHLIGDFAFAVWDPAEQRLFCAIDHMGTRPFFYARIANGFVFARSIDAVASHPHVSHELDDMALADFLVFGRQLDTDRTSYSAIRRLSAGSCLAANHKSCTSRTYWSLSADIEIRILRPAECVEAFTALLRVACVDRLRGVERATISMSGGLDSTSVASFVVEEQKRTNVLASVSALTVGFEHLLPDAEYAFAGAAARRLGLPLEFMPVDEFGPTRDLQEIIATRPEPIAEPCIGQMLAVNSRLASCGDIVLTGDDADGLLRESPKPYFHHLAKTGQWCRLAHGAISHGLSRRFVLADRAWRAVTRWPRTNGDSKSSVQAGLPGWLAPELVSDLRLQDRFATHCDTSRSLHHLRPYGYAATRFTSECSSFFDGYDPSWTGAPVDYRHPFMDVRLVNFCMALPPWPWCVDKRLLRVAMKNRLPTTVLNRPKTYVNGHPHAKQLDAGWGDWIPSSTLSPDLRRYVLMDHVSAPGAGQVPDESLEAFRPFALGWWLRGRENSRR
jgi:asparagine synthase (glutamine-hydrolysing)